MDMIFDLPGVKKIVKSFQCGFDDTQDTGVTDDNIPMDHATNFRVAQLPLYLTAIQHAGLNPADFGIADQAYGNNSDTGVRWACDPDVYKGFYYACGDDDMQKFYAAMADVIKAHPTFAHA
jgi:hypothetical protein